MPTDYPQTCLTTDHIFLDNITSDRSQKGGKFIEFSPKFLDKLKVDLVEEVCMHVYVYNMHCFIYNVRRPPIYFLIVLCS